jgi:hypothetical protein
MKRKLMKKLVGGLSLTTAMFVFQACYGTPQDFGADLFVEGLVKSKNTGQPIKGIKVSNAILPQYLYTGEDGSFSFYTESSEGCKLKFEDTDSDLNGSFADKDTILLHPGSRIFLNIFLEEK